MSGQERASLVSSIHGHLPTGEPGLERLDTMARYYFDGAGKTLRPAAMAAACNHHLQVLAWKQGDNRCTYKHCAGVPGPSDPAADFGKNIGIAFQLVDDLLDYVGSK